MSVLTERLLEHARNKNNDPHGYCLLGRLRRIKSTLYAAAKTRGIDTDFLDRYLRSVEDAPFFEDMVLQLLQVDPSPVLPTPGVPDHRATELREKFIASGELYGLERLLKFLFRSDWLLIYSTICDEFTYVDISIDEV